MAPELIKNGQSWSKADPFNLSVLDDDGQTGRMFRRDCAEIDVLVGDLGSEMWLIPLSFKTLDKACRAGNILASAFREIREIVNEPTPDCRGEHELERIRFARTSPVEWICRRCGTILETEQT